MFPCSGPLHVMSVMFPVTRRANHFLQVLRPLIECQLCAVSIIQHVICIISGTGEEPGNFLARRKSKASYTGTQACCPGALLQAHAHFPFAPCSASGSIRGDMACGWPDGRLEAARGGGNMTQKLCLHRSHPLRDCSGQQPNAGSLTASVLQHWSPCPAVARCTRSPSATVCYSST